MLTLYQAEWCPYSSAVRERLTELGVDFVAKQVAPRQEEREGEHEIPLLVDENGGRHDRARSRREGAALAPTPAECAPRGRR